MKRFLSIILTAAMLMTAVPAAFAETAPDGESIVTAEEVTPENQEVITENGSEEITDDAEKTEEQIRLMSGENEISLQADEADEVQYSIDGGAWTGSTLADAVTAIGTGTGTIKVQNDVEVSAEIKITGNVTLIADGKNVTIKRASTLTGAPVISVASGATLNLGTETAMENTLTIDGGAVWSGNDGHPNAEADQFSDKSNNIGVKSGYALVITAGTTNLYQNVTVQNNHNGSDDPHSGAGVSVTSGTFNMYGGKVCNNSCASSGESGGGVAVNVGNGNKGTSAEFNMYDGDICHNTALVGGGVCVANPMGLNEKNNGSATFTMHGGNIYENVVSSNSGYSGAGVCVSWTGTFTMTGGEIRNNTSNRLSQYDPGLGGGVFVCNEAIFKGGIIKDNTAVDGGDDIYITSASASNIGKVTLASKVDIDGKTYGVKYYFDGYKEGASADRYSETNKDELTTLTDYSQESGLKAIYEEIHISSVKVTDPIYMAATYPGGTDSKIGTISVTGAEDLTAVPAGTALELAIVIENNTYAKNHSFVKWVVKTESGTEVTVTDNKFTMPGEAVTVTAEYVPDIQMTFYAGGTYASDTNECTEYTWNEDGTITYTMPGNKGTLTISKPNGFKKWTYMSETTQNPTVTANDIVTVTVNTNEGYTFNGIKSVTSQMGKLTGTFNNSGTYTFSVPVGTHNDYRGTQNAYIILDITKNQYNITKNYNSSEGSVEVVYRSNPNTEITKAYHGSAIWIGIEPNANYKVKSVKVTDKNNAEVTLDTTYAETYKTWGFTMPMSDVTVSVEFELDACAITTNAGENGDIRLLSDNPAAIGSTVNFTVTADAYYELDTLTVKDSANADIEYQYNEESDSYSFIMPGSDVTISATFKKKQYSVTTNGSKVTFSGLDVKYTWGDTVEFTVTPDKWYNIKDVTVAGVNVTDNGNGSYSFIMPTNDVEIKVTAVRPNFNVEFVSNGGSSVDGQVIANGDTVKKPSTPTYVNHGFAGWYTSPTFEADTKYDFSTNVTGDVKLYARWFLWGDVNGDGNANSMDALLINRCRIGAISYNDLKYAIAARVNDVTNTTPNSMDALLINRHRIGAIAIYPVETQAAGYEFDLESNTFITNK